MVLWKPRGGPALHTESGLAGGQGGIAPGCGCQPSGPLVIKESRLARYLCIQGACASLMDGAQVAQEITPCTKKVNFLLPLHPTRHFILELELASVFGLRPS